MKYFKYLAIAGIFWGLSPGANALTINLDTYNCSAGSDCAAIFVSGPSNSTTEIANIEANFAVSGDLSLLYKHDQGQGELDSAPYDPWYSTEYFNSASDPKDATISWDGTGSDPSISCPECYLYVKDGNRDPNVYIFNLGTLLDLAIWNGTDDLVLTNFWPNQGAISHVAIYGVSPIPVPAAFWLFGTALIGFIGMSRRTKV